MIIDSAVYAFISIIISLAVLVTLLHLKVRIGPAAPTRVGRRGGWEAVLISACLLALLLGVWPWDVGRTLIGEWQSQPLTRTTAYLFVSLSGKGGEIVEG